MAGQHRHAEQGKRIDEGEKLREGASTERRAAMGAVTWSDRKAFLRPLASLAPWLAAAADPEQLRTALSRHEPGLPVRRAAAERLRLTADASAWTGRYQVTLDGSEKAVALIGILRLPGVAAPADGTPAAPFGSPGWRRVLPELGLELTPAPAEEPALPALETLTNPKRARALLEREMSAAPGHGGFRLAGCTPRVVRYKPGSRATILYELTYPPGADGPRLVAAKTYRGDKGRNAWEGMRALWASPLSAGDVVTIAEPLAYVPTLRVLLMGPVGEQATLKQLIRTALNAGTPTALAKLDAAMDGTAAGLAALHTCRVGYGEPVVIADELADIRGVLRRLALAVPKLAGAAEPLLARVEELALAHRADAAVPSHGSFRPAQVLLDGERIAFIDFDGICQAEPAMDLALFLSSVKGVGLVARGGADVTSPPRLVQLQRVCARFLDRYRQLAPISPERVALWETLHLLTEVVDAWVKVQPSKLAPAMLLLEGHLDGAGLPNG
jgi:hypothetical protein